MKKKLRDQMDAEQIKYAALVKILLESLFDDSDHFSVYYSDELSYALISTALKIRDLKKDYYKSAFADPASSAPEIIRGLRAKNTKRRSK